MEKDFIFKIQTPAGHVDAERALPYDRRLQDE
jgi:hypothetical protein